MQKKANWNHLKEHVKEFGKTSYSRKWNNINQAWIAFRNILESGIKQHIPHKTAKMKIHVPWLTVNS